jgi:hypothetical protein
LRRCAWIASAVESSSRLWRSLFANMAATMPSSVEWDWGSQASAVYHQAGRRWVVRCQFHCPFSHFELPSPPSLHYGSPVNVAVRPLSTSYAVRTDAEEL